MTPAELSTWLREHPDNVVFLCGCIWVVPTIAALSQTPLMDCPKHRIALWQVRHFLPFKP